MDRRNSLKLGASIVAGMAIVPGLNASEKMPEGQPMESFWDVVLNRRSVRAFKPDPIPEEDLIKIINAARLAPTSGNQQPWKFLIIRDRKKIDALKTEALKGTEAYLRDTRNLSGDELKKQLEKSEASLANGYLSAPAIIVVLTDNNSRYPTYNHWDGPLAAGYMMLAARAMGYGTVFITDSFPEELTKKVFNIPDQYTRVCISPIGIPVEWPKKEKKDLAEFIVNESF
ncbi:MAG: nitroreductase family protein [Mariniphaga sp.]|nr:nitroreductase family protein [Mariniphaga sp.]